MPFWPLQNGSHEMLQGHGDGSPLSNYRFHEGIDLLGSGNGGEIVVAARSGIVEYNDPNFDPTYGGRVAIVVDVPGGQEWDDYLHLDLSDPAYRAPPVGSPITEGDVVGKIMAGGFGAGGRHLHLSVLKAKPPATGATTFLNAFLRFTATADRDPLLNSPDLANTNSDPDDLKLLITRSGTTGPHLAQPINGDVDLIADVRDKMCNYVNYLMASGPHSIGYYITPAFQGSHGVKTQAAPYVLAKFDDNWFPDQPFSKNKFLLVYADVAALRVNPNPVSIPFIRHYIVTNTKGTDGRVDNVVDQYWNTDAVDDNEPDTVAHANYAGKADSGRNALARFKDGNYWVNIVLTDLRVSVDITVGKVRVVNFPRVCGTSPGGMTPPVGTPTPLPIPGPAGYIPPFNPTPQSTGAGQFYQLGQTIGIWGDQYYPSFYMYAYILPYKPGGWNEGDPLSPYVARIVVQSNFGGGVPLTAAWVANQTGQFDVIIDYDNDGFFSWKLDGLGSCTVLAP